MNISCDILWFTLHRVSITWRLKSSATRLLVHQLDQINRNENTKVSHNCPFLNGIHRWLVVRDEYASHRASNVESVSISWPHHVEYMRLEIWRVAQKINYFYYGRLLLRKDYVWPLLWIIALVRIVREENVVSGKMGRDMLRIFRTHLKCAKWTFWHISNYT